MFYVLIAATKCSDLSCLHLGHEFPSNKVRMVSKVSKVSKVPGGQRDAVRRGGQKFRIGAGDHIASMNRGHLLLWVVCAAGISQAMGYPQGDLITPDSDESDVSGIGFVTLDGTNSEGSVESGQANASDDLIFLSRKKPSSSNNSVDLSPFLSMIYVPEVQAIVASYYHGDAEFQRAYAFLASRDFADIKRKILQLPEVLEFTNYLSVHGLDVIKVVQSVADKFKPSELGEVVGDREPQNGLHGMVERVMEILPLDQLYVQFFDEFESNKQFAALVDSISSPKFAKILSGLQNSLPLRNLLFVLHNNSIFVERIVETVKSHLSLRGDFVSR